MRTKANAYALSLKTIATLAAVVLVLATGWTLANATVYTSTRVINGYDTDIRVWLEHDYDVYPSEDNLVFNIRAVRDCYATVYVVDTDGFIHVIYPLSPYDNAYIRGGMVYRFSPRRSDIFYSAYPRGIAYVFAVSSPVPFVYANFGVGIFGGTSVYRIYGDPFIACKRFYVSLLPRWVIMDRVSISFAHFYIREWVRYPHYLCRHHHHWGEHHCADFDYAYRSYRLHHNSPYRVLRPDVQLPRAEREYTSIVKTKSVRNGGFDTATRSRVKRSVDRSRVVTKQVKQVRSTPAARSTATSRQTAVKTSVKTSAKTRAATPVRKVSVKSSSRSSRDTSARVKTSTRTSSRGSAGKTSKTAAVKNASRTKVKTKAKR